MLLKNLCLLAVVPLVAAFEDTVPVLVLTSKSVSFPRLPQLMKREELNSQVFSQVGCPKFSIVFEQDEMHHSMLKDHPLFLQAGNDASVAYIPYVDQGADDAKEGSFVQSMRDRCRQQGVNVVVHHVDLNENVSAETAISSLNKFDNDHHVLVASSKNSNEATIQNKIAKLQTSLLQAVQDALSTFKAAEHDWMALFTGKKSCKAKQLITRDAQMGPTFTLESEGAVQAEIVSLNRRSMLDEVYLETRAVHNASATPYSKRSVFDKYTFFNSALFMCLSALVPLLFVAFAGVSLLSNIQTPSRFDVKRKEK